MPTRKRKTTEELINEIRGTDSAESFISKNRDEFIDKTLSDHINRMMEKYGVKKSELFRKAGLDGNNYAYEVVRGDKKNPSRDVVLRLCLAIPCDLDEVQQALRFAGKAPLYPRNKRDVFIMFAIKNALLPEELNDKLNENGMKLLE